MQFAFMKFKVVFIFWILIFPFVLKAQDEVEIPYTTEKLIGVNFNTNAGFLGGVIGKYSKKAKKKTFNTYTLELVNIRHSQELKVSSVSTGNNFIFAKENYLFVIRPSYLKEFMLFRAAREEGVQINAAIGGGISIGIQKPYYIKYDYAIQGKNSVVKEEAFDPRVHRDIRRILGHAGLFDGIWDSKIVPALHAKGSVTFYFGNYGKRVSALEAGGLIEGFFQPDNLKPDRVMILANVKNNWLYTAFFLNIVYGWRK